MEKAQGRVFVWVALMLAATATPAQTERVISPQELSRLNPEAVSRIESGSATRLSPAAMRRLDSVAIRAPAAGDAATAAASQPALRIRPDQYVVVASAEPTRTFSCDQAGNGQCIETPLRYLAMTPQGESLDLSLVLASTDRLRFDNESERFVASIFVQLRDMKAPDAVKDIGSAIRVVVNAEVDEIQPNPMVEIVQTNRFSDLTLTVSEPQDPTLVRLTPERMAQAQELTFGVARPSLKVELGTDSILGFGLETTSVTVQTDGVATAPTNAISITTESGHLDQPSLRIDRETRIASTLLRSRGTGPDRVTASLSPFTSGVDDIEYEMPWSWFIAVGLGMVVGIGIRLAMRAKQQPPASGVGFNIVLGAIGGIITAVLYALGVNILPLPLPGGFSESLTFVLSALGGWVFPRWLETLSPAKPAGET